MLMKCLQYRVVALIIMCASLLSFSFNHAAQRAQSRPRFSRDDIKQIETALGLLKKNPSSSAWRNEAKRSIDVLAKTDRSRAAGYQRQYDAIVQGVALESAATVIKKQLDFELSMLKKNPNNSMWQDRARGNIDAIMKEDPVLAVDYQRQYNAIMGIEEKAPAVVAAIVPEDDIKQVERAINILKNNPSSTTWRNEATRYINIIGKIDPALAANYQSQYDAIVGGVAVESKAKAIAKQLDVELGMLKRNPKNSMWQNKVRANIDALMQEEPNLAEDYQNKYNAIVGM